MVVLVGFRDEKPRRKNVGVSEGSAGAGKVQTGIVRLTRNKEHLNPGTTK